jgi:hypothetical protein
MRPDKKAIMLFAFVFILEFSLPQNNNLIAQIDYNVYQISLLTYSPGEKLYSVFGHSAIRVLGEETDLVYNFGTFDFDDPDFYLKFIRGKLMYRLSRVPFSTVLQNNQLENRSLVETPLHLSVGQKTKMIRYLKMNYLPENRDYRYDFLYNNCSTKIIDVINFGTSNLTAYNPISVPHKSFRRLLDPYLELRSWTHMGVDFLMGLPADKKSEGTEASFLPDYLHLLVKNAKVAEISGGSHGLSLSDKIHYQEIQRKHKSFLKPEWILWPLVLICIVSLILGTYFSNFFKWLNKVLLFSFGLLGLLLLTLSFTTNHYIFNVNTDILWANPLLLIVSFLKSGSANTLVNKIKIIFLFLIIFMASAGALTSFFIEENLNLTALSFLVIVALYDKIKSIHQAPRKQLLFD